MSAAPASPVSAVKVSAPRRHSSSMSMLRLAALLVMTVTASYAAEAEDIRSALERFNQGVREQSMDKIRTLFAPEADYRDGARQLQGIDAILALLSDKEVWSERTRPMLQKPSIKLINTSVALVDAQMVSYGSVIVKSALPVILLMERKGPEGWTISSWRMCSCPLPFSAE